MGPLRSDRTSICMEMTAWGCRAARTVHEPVPMQSPGSLVSERPKPYLDRLAQSRWGSVPASSSGPTDPVLRANLFPKLWIRLANFPYLHCSIDQRLFTLETCCGYGYDLKRQSTLVPRIFKGLPNTGHCSRRSALRSSQFQANPPLTKKRQLFPGLQPASEGSIASQSSDRLEAANSAFRFGNIDPIPFRPEGAYPHEAGPHRRSEWNFPRP